MGKGGKYLNKKAPAAKKPKGKKKLLSKILIGVLVFLLIIVGAVALYINHLMNLITRPDDVVVQPTETFAVAETEATEEEATVGTTTPEDTWPEIVSDKNITNILVVGQAARAGEEALIADTMILCSINRETKTLTLTSLMRDMRLVWPEYTDYQGKVHTGNNRINMAYNMGYRWANDNPRGGMEVLSSIIEYNFGVPVDNVVEVNFDMFSDIVDLLEGVTVHIDEAELEYLQKNYNYMDKLTVGENNLSGYRALCYARMRKVGHGDYERTERQREVITNLIEKMKGFGILNIHKVFTHLLPNIITDMTNQEMTNYAFEFIPMLKDLKIQSQRIPFDGNEMSVSHTYEDGTVDNMIAPRDLKATAKQLQESIGMTPAN